MSEVVFVAILGISGTLLAGVLGAVIAPLVQAAAAERSAERGRVRARVGKLLLVIEQGLGEMLHENSSGALYWQTWRTVDAAITELQLIVPKKAEGVPQALGSMLYVARKQDDAVEQSVAASMVLAAIGGARQWYRGSRAPKNLTQRVLDFGEGQREAILDGRILIGGKPLAQVRAEQAAEVDPNAPVE